MLKMITQRRIFQAKPGAAGAVVAKMKEFQPILQKSSGTGGRIYTDLYSGHTDQVVWEFDTESLGKLENFNQDLLQNNELRKAFEKWFEGLQPLIEGATVELWTREV
jgi:hypothetical protein